MEKRTVGGGGLGITSILWIIFIVLKIVGVAFVNTSWVIIILWPIFLTIAVAGIIVGVVALYALLKLLVYKLENK